MSIKIGPVRFAFNEPLLEAKSGGWRLFGCYHAEGKWFLGFSMQVK